MTWCATVSPSTVQAKESGGCRNLSCGAVDNEANESSQVQILVHVCPADRPGDKFYELLECSIDTSIREVKQKVIGFSDSPQAAFVI